MPFCLIVLLIGMPAKNRLSERPPIVLARTCCRWKMSDRSLLHVVCVTNRVPSANDPRAVSMRIYMGCFALTFQGCAAALFRHDGLMCVSRVSRGQLSLGGPQYVR